MMSKLTLTGFVSLIGLATAFAGGPTLDLSVLQGLAGLAVATTQTAGDCNGNSVPDDEDIANETSQDCNQNGRPDECEFVAELTATGAAYTEGETPRGQAFSSSFFYVHPANASDRFVGEVAINDLKDIAVDPTTGLIYTVDLQFTVALDEVGQHLYLVDPVTGAGTQLPSPTTLELPFPVLGLTFGLDGTLYGIGNAGFVVLDKATGAITETLNLETFGFGMATSPAGAIYSITRGQPPVPSIDITPNGFSVLQRHDPATGGVISSVEVPDPLQQERQIIDIAFGADGVLYGITGYIYSYSDFQFDIMFFMGQGLAIIDPTTGVWTDVGPFIGDLHGLGGPVAPAASDCNENSILDECETDCNDNGIPDDCDIAAGAPDCNGNQIPDSCDIASGASLDCQLDGIPDECQLAGNDCNGNGIPDACDIASGTSKDCNQNGLPDECDSPLVLGACPADITIQATDAAGIVVSYSTPQAQNGCNPAVTVSPPSGSLFPIGTTTVTVRVTDDAGATRSCTFQVTVLPPPEPDPQGQPEPQPAPPPVCVLFLFQSLFGIPLCGPCGLIGLAGTLVGLMGLRRQIRRWR